jgi:hypothetical protein
MQNPVYIACFVKLYDADNRGSTALLAVSSNVYAIKLHAVLELCKKRWNEHAVYLTGFSFDEPLAETEDTNS